MAEVFKQKNEFISPGLSYQNFDLYLIRKRILDAIDLAIPRFMGKMLDIGCGKMPYREYILSRSNVRDYIGMDIESARTYDENIHPDYTWDGKTMPFADNFFDCALGTEVLEHCPEPEIVLKETCRVLKPGGVFFFTVPFLWNLHEAPQDEYRYTPFSLERHLKNSGFKNVDIHATGGWHAAMAQMLGLWVKRAPMPPVARKGFYFLIYPLYRWLEAISKKENIRFSEGAMITGLYGTAVK
jgi:SAM-dependent methyltransferase